MEPNRIDSNLEKQKGAISRAGINLLISSLIIVLVIVIWIVIRGITEGGDNQQITLNDSTLDLKISQVQKINDSTLNVTIKRNVGEGEFVALSFTVNDGTTTEIIRKNVSMDELDNESISLDFIILNASKVKSISISPILEDKSGEEVVGNAKDEYITPNTCSNYCPTGAQCGVNGCGAKCGSGCTSGYLCLSYKCIKQSTSSGGGGGGGSSNTCTDTCSSLGYSCGTRTICESSVNCGTCGTNYTCQTNGTCIANICIPTTCLALGRTCGNISDGCTGTLNCGSCSTGYTCQINGTCIANPINCTDTCSSLGHTCGNQTVCGVSTNCGTCGTGYYCSAGDCLACTTHNSSSCYNGDVYWYNSCSERETIRYDCNATQNCTAGACMNICTTHNLSSCYNGDVYWYNSCGSRETIRYDCNATQNCTAGACMNICTPETNSTFCSRLNKNCGSVTALDNCGISRTVASCGTCTLPQTCNATNRCSCTAESNTTFCSRLNKNCGSVTALDNCGISRTVASCGTCTLPQTCSNGACTTPSTGGAIIADHNAARDFDIIPKCWLDKARSEIRVAYQHTSHGSQIPTGMEYLRAYVNSTLYAYDPSIRSGYLLFRDYGIDGYGGYYAPDLGYGNWALATRAYLDASPTMNNIMWSWCGQASGYSTYSAMNSWYFTPAQAIVADYSNIDFVYMTGHLEGTGPSGTLYQADNLIRQHVLAINGTLFDFADIESWDPAGNYYPDESDACSWCDSWCSSHDCTSIYAAIPDGSCAHTDSFNCVQKAKAYWWMLARLAGWNGSANQPCS